VGRGVATGPVRVAVAVGAAVSKPDPLRAKPIAAQMPLFMEPTSEGIVPAGPRSLSATATPKFDPLKYCSIINPDKSLGSTKLTLLVAKKASYRSLLEWVANEHTKGALLVPWLVQEPSRNAEGVRPR
jgi:hypothetical protein